MLLLLEALPGDTRYCDIVPEMLEQEREGGSVSMCELIDKYEKRGIQQGMQQGIQRGAESAIRASIKNLMKNLKLTAEQAMAVLEIPEDERQKYLRLIR